MEQSLYSYWLVQALKGHADGDVLQYLVDIGGDDIFAGEMAAFQGQEGRGDLPLHHEPFALMGISFEDIGKIGVDV